MKTAVEHNMTRARRPDLQRKGRLTAGAYAAHGLGQGAAIRAHRLVCALTFGLVAISASGAGALEVAAGCDEPRASEHGRTFFVDPERGDKSNDGSEQKPWRTLAEVLDPANRLVSTCGSEGQAPASSSTRSAKYFLLYSVNDVSMLAAK